MTHHPIISTENLTRRFGDVLAVDGLTMSVERGEVFGFLGHNGAGKTTTIRLLNGVLQPTGGRSTVLGYNPAADGPALRHHTGVLTESPSLDERLTARENLTIFADLYGVPEREVDARVESLLAMFELAERADDKVGGYSKGMKQRMALARAMIHRPDILFLDEPTAGLDPVAARQVHELIVRLSREEGGTVFLCTHNLVEAQKLCDRVAVLQQGRLLAEGTPGALARRYAHRRVIELEVAPDSVAPAAELLARLPHITGVEADRSVLRFSGADHEAIPDVIARLAAGGVRIYRVTPEEPSLEDVYFALHEGEVARNSAALEREVQA